MNHRVSVVMAAKNYARFLPAAIESVQDQTCPDWELVIIDDGSTDDTPAVVRPYLSDPRVRYFRSDRLGQSRAKNLGIGLSRGEFISFLDADDAWLPAKLEKQLALFEGRPEVGVVYCRRLLMDEEGNVQAATPQAAMHRGQVVTEMFVQNFVCFSSAMVRRRVFEHVGSFDPLWDLSIDYDLWLRVAKHHGFDFVDEELVLYRTGHGNLSKRLADRVATALSIMHRAESRYGIADQVAPEVVNEGYASTCRTLGYVMRPSEPLIAARWYLRSLRWPGRRWLSAKGLAAALLVFARGRRSLPAPENASENL